MPFLRLGLQRGGWACEKQMTEDLDASTRSEQDLAPTPDLGDILLVSTAEWDAPHWTNKQHVACQLVKRGYRVFYVESLGLRRPFLNKRDTLRIASRLKRMFAPPRLVQPGLWVWSPVVPLIGFSNVTRKLGRIFLANRLSNWATILKLDLKTLWTYNPLTPELFLCRQFRTVIYHCVDEVAEQPGMPAKLIRNVEQVLCKESKVIFATSRHLEVSRRKINPRTFYLPNVADYEHFSRAQKPSQAMALELEKLQRPIIGFVGSFSRIKIDVALLEHLVTSEPTWSFVFVGQIGLGERNDDLGGLIRAKNVYFLGAQKYENLPAYLKGFDVGILPALLNDYTKGMFPMKFFEYLAAGLPVVSTNLPALTEFREVVDLAEGPHDFLCKLRSVVRGSCPALVKRLSVAREYTYEKRTSQMLDIVADAIR